MNGKEVKQKIFNQLKNIHYSTPLGLAVLQVGNDEASNVYIKQKRKMAEELGFIFIHKVFSDDATQEEIITEIQKLNEDDSIDGILVQMPLPKHLDSSVIQNSIHPNKDVDGLTQINIGRLLSNKDGLIPCTPKGIVDLLEYYHISVDGKNVVVIGRSLLVGKPTANLLLNKNATVTVCHSKTENIKEYTLNADIVIVAVGKAGFLTEDMVSDNVIVIDVGINRIDGKLYGDVDFDNVSKKASYITPVPGGVGPMTVAELACNVYKAHDLKNK